MQAGHHLCPWTFPHLFSNFIISGDKYSLKEPEKVQEIRKKIELGIEHVVQGTEKNSAALWIQMTRNLISSLQSMKDIAEKEHSSVCQMPSIVNFLLNE